MPFESTAARLRLDLRPLCLLRILIGLAGLRVILALWAATSTGASSAAEAGRWILCASSWS